MSKDQFGDYEELGYIGYKLYFSKNTINYMNKIIDNLNLKPSYTVFDESNTGKSA